MQTRRDAWALLADWRAIGRGLDRSPGDAEAMALQIEALRLRSEYLGLIAEALAVGIPPPPPFPTFGNVHRG